MERRRSTNRRHGASTEVTLVECGNIDVMPKQQCSYSRRISENLPNATITHAPQHAPKPSTARRSQVMWQLQGLLLWIGACQSMPLLAFEWPSIPCNTKSRQTLAGAWPDRDGSSRRILLHRAAPCDGPTDLRT